MIALWDPGCLQGSFSILLGMLDRLGLKTSVDNTVKMLYRLFQVTGTQLEADYERHMTGAGPYYR